MDSMDFTHFRLALSVSINGDIECEIPPIENQFEESQRLHNSDSHDPITTMSTAPAPPIHNHFFGPRQAYQDVPNLPEELSHDCLLYRNQAHETVPVLPGDQNQDHFLHGNQAHQEVSGLPKEQTHNHLLYGNQAHQEVPGLPKEQTHNHLLYHNQAHQNVPSLLNELLGPESPGSNLTQGYLHRPSGAYFPERHHPYMPQNPYLNYPGTFFNNSSLFNVTLCQPSGLVGMADAVGLSGGFGGPMHKVVTTGFPPALNDGQQHNGGQQHNEGQQQDKARQPVYKCSHCSQTSASTWRLHKGQRVCNACGLYWKVKQKLRPAELFTDQIKTRRRKPKVKNDPQPADGDSSGVDSTTGPTGSSL